MVKLGQSQTEKDKSRMRLEEELEGDRTIWRQKVVEAKYQLGYTRPWEWSRVVNYKHGTRLTKIILIDCIVVPFSSSKFKLDKYTFYK